MGKRTKCVAYLSSDGDIYSAEIRENKQLRYLRDYASAHNLDICTVVRRKGLGQKRVNEQWSQMVAMIQKGMIEGVLIANTEVVSSSIPDSFYKVGQVYEAGGIVITVDEGRLSMPVKRAIDGRMELINDRV